MPLRYFVVVLARVTGILRIILEEGLLSQEHMLRCQSHLTHFSMTTRYRDIPSLNDIYNSPQALNINSLYYKQANDISLKL